MNRRKNRAPSNGLTLIEAALAIGLLGLVAVAAFTAAGTGLQAWKDGREALAVDRRNAIWNDRLHAAIAGMVPMTALVDEHRGPRRVFFQGDADGMRFVTTHSPIADGRAGVRLVELRATGAGAGTELLLTEAPCPTAIALGELLGNPSGTVRPGDSPASPDDWRGLYTERVIARPLSSWKFQYLRDSTGPSRHGGWVARWEDRRAIPRAVRIEWVEKRGRGGPGNGRASVITVAVLGATRDSIEFDSGV